ncbi:hypothetical protein IT570_10935 [Candidatus Sumerlaeota bacterium]|nr:hypothetical protein [Candidatus Sumerlaeota bacterium]
MKRTIETSILVCIIVGIAVGLTRMPTESAPTEDQPTSQLVLHRKWTTEMRLENGEFAKFDIALNVDEFGKATVVCDLPDLDIYGIRATDAAYYNGNLMFRNELGRFKGTDLGIFMTLAMGEFSEAEAKATEQQFFCDVIEAGSR